MKRLASAFAVAAFTAVLVIGPALSAQAAGCSESDALTTGCPTVTGGINGDDVELSGTSTTPGRGHSGPRSTPTPTPAPPPPLRDGYSVTRPVTLADLINFRPTPSVAYMEPSGWMVVGLDTNFYATGGPEIQTGELLGHTANVRFTAVRYHWSYGDGRSANLTTKGASWASLGLADFDRTATSHIYRAPGSYSITLSVDFSAEYQYSAGDWIAIAGTLPVAANQLTATAADASTVLVRDDCRANPSAPGC